MFEDVALDSRTAHVALRLTFSLCQSHTPCFDYSNKSEITIKIDIIITVSTALSGE